MDSNPDNESEKMIKLLCFECQIISRDRFRAMSSAVKMLAFCELLACCDQTFCSVLYLPLQEKHC